MPIRTNLNESPYYDDYDITKQYHRVLFRPGYAVQARELTQLQTILQNQVEQFGDNIFKEGSIIKGCTFTELSQLKYVKVTDAASNILFPSLPITVNELVGSIDEETGIQTFYKILGAETELEALIIQASFGYETNDPDLNTFYITYLNSTNSQVKVFNQGEKLQVYRYTIEDDVTSAAVPVAEFTVTSRSNHVGDSFGIQSAIGIVYQKGTFLYAKEQTVILSKYTNIPDNVAIGYRVKESKISALSDPKLYDNSIGSPNENAPGANRLKLEPILIAISTTEADADPTFFALSRYSNGLAVQVRDVSQYNVLGNEMSRRTFEESGNYIIKGFKTNIITSANNSIRAAIEPGLAYIKGFRVETKGEISVEINGIEDTETESQSNQSVIFNYGSYVDISNTDPVGTLPVGTYQTASLKNIGGTTIGTALVRNFTPTKVYLSNVRMGANNFADVASITDGVGGAVKIIPTIKQTKNDSLVFDTGETFLKTITSISVPVRKARSLPDSGTSDTLIVPALSGEDFNVDINETNTLVVDSTQDNLQIASIVKNSDTQITINFVPGQSPTTNKTIYYNSRIINAAPHGKLSKTLYVKAAYASGTKKYSLGIPDVYKLVSVIDADNNDVTKSFRLKENQKDHYYDLSFIEYIPGNPEPAIGAMTITINAFKLNTLGSYFFTVDSYPADLDLSYIPTYRNTSGTNLYLRDCIDFRPYAANTVSYTEVLGDAPTVSTSVEASPTFSGTFLIPALNSFANIDYDYYLNRTDQITVDSYGRFSVVRGKPARKSAPAPVGDDRFVLAEVYIPGYPAISGLRAAQENKPLLAIKSRLSGTKNYTMKDIEFMDKKLDQLIYYTTLSLLESSTQNLNITDENGLTRFKNGILVDPFDDLSIADTIDPDFNAAIDFTEKSLTPSVKTIPINLKYKSSTNVTLHPDTSNIDVGTLITTTNIPVISQQYATTYRNCVSNFYNYIGRGQLYPEYDSAFDTVKSPDINVDIDLATPFVEYNEKLNKISPIVSSKTKIIQSDVNSTKVAGGTQFYDTAKVTRQTLQVTQGIKTQQDLGDFVKNVNFNPYMRSRELKVLIYGLRPNTRHYFFFDGVDVNNYVIPGIVPTSDKIRDVVPAGTTVTSVISDSIGAIAAIFTIPPEKFYVGDRVLTIIDVDNLDNAESASTSAGKLVYRAFNLSSETQGLTLSTRMPNIEIVESSTNNNVAGRFVADPPPKESTPSGGGGGGGGGGSNNWRGKNGEVYGSEAEANKYGGGVKSYTPDSPTSSGSKSISTGKQTAIGNSSNSSPSGPVSRASTGSASKYSGKDPLAQTFFIKSGMTQGNECIFASRIDIFFKRKSATNGVTVMLREVVNGYPSREILPFSEVHKRASDPDMITSNDGSIATPFFFTAPVRLDSEKEYCVVIMPDGDDPDYIVFTSKSGLNDLATGTPIITDWGDGVLFTSTNNRAWQSYQDEDLKFTLYRREFNETSGSLILTNDDNEFLKVNNITGNFQNGELVYITKNISGGTSNTVNIVTGNTEMTGSGLSSTYAANDYIYVYNDLETVFDLFKVVQRTSTTITLDRPAKFSGEYNARPAVIGKIIYYDDTNPELMYLEASSATVSKFFEVGDIVTGFTTRSYATISSIDNIEISYIQPFIARTSSLNTDISLVGTFTDPSDTDIEYIKEMVFNDKSSFNEKGCVIFSKSNGSKTFELELRLNNRSNSIVTPVIDIETASILAYQYEINAGANTDTTSSYVSKMIELAENLDAEDFILYATAYRPVNTDINIYIKVQNASDPLAFEVNEWIQLELATDSQFYSSLSNTNDFREFVYKLPDNSSNIIPGKVDGVLTYSNTSGEYSGYRKFAVKIEFIANEVGGRVAIGSVPRLLDYRGIAIT